MQQTQALPRVLSLWSAICVVAGAVIGSGVFLVASDIARATPASWAGLAVWGIAGLASLVGGLVFAELGAAFPGAGGQYVYLREAFGPLWAFLFGWTWILVIQPGSIAAVAVSVARFAGTWLPTQGFSGQVFASCVIVFFTGINLLGMKKGARVLDALTVFKILALVALGVAAVFAPVVAVSDAGGAGTVTLSGFGVALIAALWAFDGWNNVSFVAGEIVNPKRNVPLALFLGIAAVAALYVGANSFYYRVLGVAGVGGSSFVAADAVAVLGGEAARRALIFAVALSAAGCVNGLVLAGARVAYAMAIDGELPSFLARVSERHEAPAPALLLQMLVSLALTWSGSYDQLFTYVVCAAFLFYALTALALIVLRVRRPGLERPYRAPFYPGLPIAYLAFCVWFVANAFIEKPKEALIGLLIVAAGIPVYALMRRQRVLSTDQQSVDKLVS